MELFCPYCKSSNLVKDGFKSRAGSEKQNYMCNTCNRQTVNPIHDPELISENVRLAKRTQLFQDSNRIERKGFREYARIENALEAHSLAIKEALDKIDVEQFSIQHESVNSKAAGIAQISDPHFNELVNLPHNKYDFSNASKRLKYYAEQTKIYFKPFGVKNVLIACVGDLLNSDRRLDELLSNATNRANASMLSVYLMEQFILHLNKDFNISVASVTGNESRVGENYSFNELVATDNYDSTIFNTLKYGMRHCKGIKFISGDPSELIVSVAGQNILLLHGHARQIRKQDIEGSVQSIIGKYAKRKIVIDFVLFGHVHSAYISEHFARGGSLVGDNAYSDRDLQLCGRPSQNAHILFENGNRDSTKIDLTNTGDIQGYNIVKELEAYNAKSAKKAKSKTVIFQVVT